MEFKGKILKQLIILIAVFIIFPLNILAYFQDEDRVENNLFQIGKFGFELNEGEIYLNNITPQQYGVKAVSLKQKNLIPLKYNISADFLAGGLCTKLHLKALMDGEALWEGDLRDFNYHVNALILEDNWQLELSLNDTNSTVQNKNCQFQIKIAAWQQNLPDNSQGFTQDETVMVQASSGNWQGGVFLNEFLPNPAGIAFGYDFGEDGDEMPQGEWIELYNTSPNYIDLKNWYLRDEANHTILITDDNTQPSPAIINGHGWLVVYLNQAILNNSSSHSQPADTIYLYDNNNNLIDSYSYFGTNCEQVPTPGLDNPDNPPNDCNKICAVPGNKSYARIPDGEGAWYDPFPTPGKANSLTASTTAINELDLGNNTTSQLNFSSNSTTPLHLSNNTSSGLK
jgi:hypothetical protein